ncbi:MAG: RidA family protein [Sphingomonadaceae bacterium]
MIRSGTLALALGAALASPSALAGGPTYFPRDGGYPFSEAVQAGDVLYLSGLIGEGADGKVVPGGIEAESSQVMALLGRVLARHGLGYDDVIQCTVFLTDMKEWPAFNAVYRASFKPGRYPVRAALGASGLALGARVELQCNAWNPKRKKR